MTKNSYLIKSISYVLKCRKYVAVNQFCSFSGTKTSDDLLPKEVSCRSIKVCGIQCCKVIIDERIINKNTNKLQTQKNIYYYSFTLALHKNYVLTLNVVMFECKEPLCKFLINSVIERRLIILHT